MFCPNCGSRIKKRANFCPECGQKIKNSGDDKKSNEKELENNKDNELEVTYAGFWKRFAAFVIDWFIIVLIAFVGGFLFGLAFPEVAENDFSTELLGILIVWIYYASMESSPKQATLGKQALGIIVTDENGNQISFGRATGRYFAKFISGTIFLIGYIMVAFTKKKQGLHDMIAKCLVINK